MKNWILVMLLVCSQSAYAQEESKLTQLWNKLKVQLDSSTIRKVDPKYIEVPDKPWRLVLRSRTDEFDMTVNSYMDKSFIEEKFGEEVTDGRFSWRQSINPPVAQSIGFYAGYRGLGFSYSYYLQKKTGRAFAFSSTGACYGLNFRLRRFKTNEIYLDDITVEEEGKRETFDPINGGLYDAFTVRSVIIDGYYLFNGRRFSQAAAYNQSVIQRRSSGSLMLGAMYHQSSLDMASDRNAILIQMNGDWGKFSIRQLNVGLGYGYNWVPGRGWLLNAMVMPTISTYNRVKMYYYDSNYSMWTGLMDDEHKPFPEDGSWIDDVKIWEKRTETDYGSVKLNIDARASITYNWDRFFLNVFGQVNRFNYGYSRTDVRLIDWYVRASFGLRL